METETTDPELVARYVAGDQAAAQTLLDRHKGFINKVVQKCSHVKHVEYDDLIAYGQMGILEAARRFDPARGVKFLTYAANWVRHYIFEQVVPPGCDRGSRHAYWEVERAKMELFQAGVSEPTAEQIRARAKRLTIGCVERTMAAVKTPLPIENEVGPHDRTGIIRHDGSEMRDPAPNAEEILAERDGKFDAKDRLRAAMVRFKPREREVVMRHAAGESFKEIGKRLGITRERVRQIEIKAHRKLRCILKREDFYVQR